MNVSGREMVLEDELTELGSSRRPHVSLETAWVPGDPALSRAWSSPEVASWHHHCCVSLGGNHTCSVSPLPLFLQLLTRSLGWAGQGGAWSEKGGGCGQRSRHPGLGGGELREREGERPTHTGRSLVSESADLPPCASTSRPAVKCSR